MPKRKNNNAKKSLHLIALLGVLAGLFVTVLLAKEQRVIQSQADVQPLFIGMNYSHHATPNCSLDNTGILLTYHEPGVRETVKNQLATMRANQVQTIRMIVWHMTDIGTNRWGVIPSAGGVVSEPYRTNLISYLTDIREAGYSRLTIAFGPTWTNGPRSDNYDPSKFEENWQLLQDVRSLVKQYGPDDTRIDLINEAAPSTWQLQNVPQLGIYVKEIYKKYVTTYGKSDVTVSAIGSSVDGEEASRLQNLIDIFKASGYGQPNWYEIHIYGNGASEQTALDDLRYTDKVLKQNNLSKPLVIGESYYNNQHVANGVLRFITSSSRPVQEFMAWPLEFGSGCKDMSAATPYTIDIYHNTLRQIGGPVISDIAAKNNKGRAVAITWTTDQPTTTELEYGGEIDVFSATPKNEIDTTLLTQHSVTLKGLKENKRYFFRVLAKNGVGKLSISPIKSFVVN